MKIKAFEVDKFLENPLLAGNGLLFFGPNSGLVSTLNDEVVSFFVSKGYSKVGIDGTELDSQPELLGNEVFNSGLFLDKKIISIRQATNKSVKTLEYILSSENFDKDSVFITITGDDLDTKSALRAFFEKSNAVVAIPCYNDDSKASEGAIKRFFAKHNIKIGITEVVQIANVSVGDRMDLMNNLNKMLLYIGDKETVEAEDVIAIMDEDKELEIDEFIDSVCLGNILELSKALNSLVLRGISTVAIVRSLVLHFLKLGKMKKNIMNGENITQELTKERIFFKRTAKVTKQLNSLTIELINNAILDLTELEIGVKSNSATDSLTISEIKSFAIAFELRKDF